MKPKTFWRLHPDEFHWLAEATRPAKMVGKMTEAEAEEIYQEAFGDEDD